MTLESMLATVMIIIIASWIRRNLIALEKARYPLKWIRFAGKREICLTHEYITVWSVAWMPLLITRYYHSTLLLD